MNRPHCIFCAPGVDCPQHPSNEEGLPVDDLNEIANQLADYARMGPSKADLQTRARRLLSNYAKKNRPSALDLRRCDKCHLCLEHTAAVDARLKER